MTEKKRTRKKKSDVTATDQIPLKDETDDEELNEIDFKNERVITKKKPKRCDRLTIILSILNVIFLLPVIGIAVAVIITSFRGMAYSDQTSIWAWTICGIFMILVLLIFFCFAMCIHCVSFLWKNRMKQWAEFFTLFIANMIIFILAIICVTQYIGFCNTYKCEPYNLIRGVVKFNSTII
jgi:hypothetical protein